MRKLRFLCGCAVAVVLTIAPVASAQDINLNIFNTATSGPQAGLVGPAGGLGETWNQHSTTSATNLLDTSGNATTVGFTSSGNSWGGPDTWGSPSLGLLRDGLRNFDTNNPSNNQQLVINGLTEGDVFDVWIASANILNQPFPNNFAVQRAHGEWTISNPTSSAVSQIIDNTLDVNGATFVQGNNFALWENVVVDASGEIVFDGFSINQQPDFDNRLPLNGFQIRAASAVVPEPASVAIWTVLGLGLAGLGYYRSRRKK